MSKFKRSQEVRYKGQKSIFIGYFTNTLCNIVVGDDL